MSLNSINAYVNEIIGSNRDQDAEHIITYFNLMSESATHMLNRLNAARRLMGLGALSETILLPGEKKVIREAVDYILCHSQDLSADLAIIHTAGLLDLETETANNRFHVLYNVESVLIRASQLYFDNLGWWQAFVNRNKPANHFVLKFEAASKEKSKEEVSEEDTKEAA